MAIEDFKKVVQPFSVKEGGRWARVYVEMSYGNPYGNQNPDLSIHGCIGPLPSGNALGGCGQIDMEFGNNKERKDSYPEKKWAAGWSQQKWAKLMQVWKSYHMKTDVPPSVIAFLKSLPETSTKPAWV